MLRGKYQEEVRRLKLVKTNIPNGNFQKFGRSTRTTDGNIICYSYQRVGHLARACPEAIQTILEYIIIRMQLEEDMKEGYMDGINIRTIKEPKASLSSILFKICTLVEFGLLTNTITIMMVLDKDFGTTLFVAIQMEINRVTTTLIIATITASTTITIATTGTVQSEDEGVMIQIQ